MFFYKIIKIYDILFIGDIYEKNNLISTISNLNDSDYFIKYE